MMWYKWKDHIINLNKMNQIEKENDNRINFNYSVDDFYWVEYDSDKERNEEFDKICQILNCYERDYTSRCC